MLPGVSKETGGGVEGMRPNVLLALIGVCASSGRLRRQSLASDRIQVGGRIGGNGELCIDLLGRIECDRVGVGERLLDRESPPLLRRGDDRRVLVVHLPPPLLSPIAVL